MKHKVRMLKSEKGVHDGEIYPVHFEEGTEHEIGSDLLSAFVSSGSVELVTEDAATESGDGEKSEGAAPENKALKGAPENKSKKK